MKLLSVILPVILFSQILNCQILTPEVHRNDTVWQEDLSIGIQDFVQLKKLMFLFNTDEKRAFVNNLDAELLGLLNELDESYMSEIHNFKTKYTELTLQRSNQLYGYAYLDTVIELEKYFFYPNIYAILINPARLHVQPKLSTATRDKNLLLVDKILALIDNIDKDKMMQVKKFDTELKGNISEKYHRIYQGTISMEERQKYQLIDLFILMNRFVFEN